MKKSASVGLVLSAVVCLAYGCSSDDDDNSSPHAGAAGKGGSGAKGGAGGSSAKGGQGGTQAGRGGTGGRGGAGSGGAGRGGASGSGGAAGRCAEEQPQAPLAECPAWPSPDGDQGTVKTTCSFADTCRELHCGETWSQFDADGCRRPECTASSDCESNERCVSSLLAGNTDCYASVYEGCEVSGCSCTCSASADCGHPGLCQPASLLPADFECPSVGCNDAEMLVGALEWYTKGLDTNHLSDVDKAAIACEREIQRKVDQCSGHGGEGGAGAGGQSGAGAGGAGQGGASGQSGGGQAGG